MSFKEVKRRRSTRSGRVFGYDRLELALFIDALRDVLGLQPLSTQLVLKVPGQARKRKPVSPNEKFAVIPFSFRNERRQALKVEY